MKTHFSKLLAGLAMCALSVCGFAQTSQTFPIPGKPIRLIVPFPPAGTVDIQARLLGNLIQQKTGVNVVVDNRPGASTIIGGAELAKSAPDGHTLLITNGQTVSVNPHIFSRLTYDPKEFEPITILSRTTLVLLVRPDSPFKTLDDIVRYAKANPGKLNYGSYGLASGPHLYMESFLKATGITMTHVPFKGSMDSIAALMAGQLDLTFDASTIALKYSDSGRLRMISQGSPEPFVGLEKVPNFAQSGYPGLDARAGIVIYGPKGMSADTIARVSRLITESAHDPKFKKELLDSGSELVASSPAEARAFSDSAYVRWGKLIKSLNIHLD